MGTGEEWAEAIGGTGCAALVPRKARCVLPPSPSSWHPTQPLCYLHKYLLTFMGVHRDRRKGGPEPHFRKPIMGKSEAKSSGSETPTLAPTTSALTTD